MLALHLNGCCSAGIFRPCSLLPGGGWLAQSLPAARAASWQHLPGVQAPQLCPVVTPFTSGCALCLQGAQEAVQEVIHAQASRDRLVAAADQQAAYQSYVPAAIAGMGAAVANAASSIVGGGDVSACRMLSGDRQACPCMVLSCAPPQAGARALQAPSQSLVCQARAKCWDAVGGLWTACLL